MRPAYREQEKDRSAALQQNPVPLAKKIDSMRDFLRLEWLVAPRHAHWCRIGGVVGAVMGILACAVLLYTSLVGVAASAQDGAEVLGYELIILGFPLSMLVTPFARLGPVGGYTWLVLSAAVVWALLGATLGGVAALCYYRVREAYYWRA